MEGKGKGQQGKNQAKPNQNKQQQNQGKKGGGKGQGKAPQGGGQPKPPQKQVPEAGVAEPTPPVQTQALSDAPVELSQPKPAESLQSGLLPEAEVIPEKLPAANNNTQEKSKSSGLKTEGPPKSGPEPPPVPPRAAQAPRDDQALAPLAPGNNESDRAKSPVPSQDKGKNSKGSKGNNKQQGQVSSKPVDTPAVSLQVETKPQAHNDGQNKAAKQQIENPVASSESPKDPIKEAPASGKLPVQAPSFADKAKSPAPKGKSDQKDKGKEHAPSNQQKGGGPQEQSTKNDPPAQDIPAPTTQSPIALGLGSEVTGPEVSQPPLRQAQPDNVQTKQQQQQPQQKPQQPQQKAQQQQPQQKQQEQPLQKPQQKQQEPQKQSEDIQQKPQQPQQKQQQQPQQKQPEQSQQKLQQQKQPEQPQQKPQQQKQQEQPQQKPQQQKQPEQPQQKPQQQKQQEQAQQKSQQLQPQQKQQEQTQQKQQQPQQKQPEQPVQKPQQQQPQQKQLEQSQQKPQQGQQKPELPQQKPLHQQQSPPKTPSSSIASSAFPAKSASAKTPVDDFDDDLIMDADFEPLFDDLSAPPAHKPAGLVQKHSPMLDADFDPLFSQISDSTKTMVGVACPAAAKPSAPIPIPKDISKEQTQGSVSPSSPGSRSKKSKQNKGAVQQDSPKSEPVDIKNPVIATTVGLVATAVAVGSSMTGEKPVPQSPKKQQSGNSKQSPITESPQPQKSAPIDIKSAPSLDVSSLSGSPANTPKDKPLSESPSKQSTKKGKSMPIDIKPSAAAQASPIGSPLVSEAKDKPLSESPSKSKKGKSTPIDITSAAAISVPLGSPLATDASVTLSESPGKQGKKGKSPQDPGSPLPLPGSPKLSACPIVDKKPKDAKPVDEKPNDSKKQGDQNRKGNQNKEPVPTQPPKPESQKQPSKEHIPPKPSLDTSVAPEDPKPEPKKQQQNKAEKNPQKPEPKPSEVGVRTTKIDDIANMTSPTAVVDVTNRLNSLEKENVDLKKKVVDLTSLVSKLEIRVKDLEKGGKSNGAVSNAHAASQAVAKTTSIASQKSPAKADDDDGVDLFGSDSEEDEEATKIKEQRLAEYAAKKSKKPAIIAKSSIILDVKPWDDETDMKEMEKKVREISADGLLWGASKLVPLAYGIHKLQINCVVEDDKISIDWLQETIEEIQDYVQSVDVAAFNKI